MFSVLINKQADIWRQLLEFYLPNGGKVIDFIYGTGATWWPTTSKYEITKTDAVPSFDNQGIIKKDITKDDYTELGPHEAGFFDPPYLIGRQSFDYPLNFKNSREGGRLYPDSKITSHRQGLQGKRSWGTNGLSKYVENFTIEVFDERVRGINRVAAQTIVGGVFCS